jgi:hypothetical protein
MLDKTSFLTFYQHDVRWRVFTRDHLIYARERFFLAFDPPLGECGTAHSGNAKLRASLPPRGGLWRVSSERGVVHASGEPLDTMPRQPVTSRRPTAQTWVVESQARKITRSVLAKYERRRPSSIIVYFS